jgi:hypothetical protein
MIAPLGALLHAFLTHVTPTISSIRFRLPLFLLQLQLHSLSPRRQKLPVTMALKPRNMIVGNLKII